LGLSISYNIIRDFDGTMTVANHPEGGAVFTVTLQRAERPAEARDSGLAAE
jgi:two-component system C4-dicarboxylate transport sensor histidine kinase DctB